MGNKLHAVRGCNHVRVGKLSTNICYAKSWFVRSNADADANAGVARHLRVLGRQFHVRVMMVWVRLHEFQVIVGALEDDSQGERGKKKESQFSPTCAYFKGTR